MADANQTAPESTGAHAAECGVAAFWTALAALAQSHADRDRRLGYAQEALVHGR